MAGERKLSPLEQEIQDINKKVSQICLFGSTNKDLYPKVNKHVAAHFAKGVHQQDIKQLEIKRTPETYAKYQRLRRYLNFYENNEQPVSREDRLLYLEETIHSIQGLSFKYGYGNCDPMCDLVFIEAIFRNLPCDLKRIKLTQPGAEELNIIVFNNLFLSTPWHSSKVIPWKKSIAEIPDREIASYSKAYILFHLKVDDVSERSFVQEKLRQANYKDWLEKPERLKSLSRARNTCLAALEPQWKATKQYKQFSHLTFQNFLMWSCVDKAAHQTADVESLKSTFVLNNRAKALTN